MLDRIGLVMHLFGYICGAAGGAAVMFNADGITPRSWEEIILDVFFGLVIFTAGNGVGFAVNWLLTGRKAYWPDYSLDEASRK